MIGSVARRTPAIGAINRCRTVPKIVPASAQNPASRANSSQIARSRKLLKYEDLRGKTKMADRLIDV